MTINRRLEKIEEQIPSRKEWRYNSRDLTDLEQGWGPLGEGEAEFLVRLSLEEAQRLERNFYHMPIEQLRDWAAQYAVARYVYFCRTLTHWNAPVPQEELEASVPLQN